MSTPIFTDIKAAEEYKCSICLEIFTDPVQIQCSGVHVFCRQCIQQSIAATLIHNIHNPSFRCPICATNFSVRSIQSNGFVNRQLKNLMVKCPNSQFDDDENEFENTDNKQMEIDTADEGMRNENNVIENANNVIENVNNFGAKPKVEHPQNCDWSGRYGDFRNHVENCPLQLIQCQYCNSGKLRKFMVNHLAICGEVPVQCPKCHDANIKRKCWIDHVKRKCIMRIVLCPLCKQKMKFVKYNSHSNTECLERVVCCGYRKYGCQIKVKRKDMLKHYKEQCDKHLAAVVHKCERLEFRMNVLEARMNFSEVLNEINDV
eukprot:223359_1